MTTIGLIILIILILAVVSLSREWAAVGVIASVLYLTSGQQIYVGGFNIFAIRFIEIAGFARIIARKEFSHVKLNSIDRSYLLFQIVYVSVFLIHSFVEISLIDTPSYRIGYFIDGVLSYFIFRALLSDPEIFKLFLKRCAFLLIPFALFMVNESMTGRNLFAFMGGVPEVPVLRDGHYRAQATFRVAITAGSVGATLFPLYIYGILSRGGREWGIIGVITCLVIIYTSHSSGPLLGFVSGIIAWMCWPIRKNMRFVRWGIVFSVIFLQLMMKPPVWFIFSKISDYIGGDGWHRSNLIDKFVHHFSDWWLMGMPLEKTKNWAATTLDSGSVDITSQYVAIGLGAGLITLILFIRFLIKCYQALGESLRKMRSRADDFKQDELLLWGIGSALITHIVNISAVIYFDQMYVIWYVTLAIVSSVSAYYLSKNDALDLDGIKH